MRISDARTVARMSENHDTLTDTCPYCDLASWLVVHGGTELGEAVTQALETSILFNAAKLDGDRGQHPELLEPQLSAREEAQAHVGELSQVIGYVNSPLEVSLTQRFPTLLTRAL